MLKGRFSLGSVFSRSWKITSFKRDSSTLVNRGKREIHTVYANSRGCLKGVLKWCRYRLRMLVITIWRVRCDGLHLE